MAGDVENNPPIDVDDFSVSILGTLYVTQEIRSQGAAVLTTGSTIKADQLKTARNIDGVDFDGTGDIIHYGVCSTAAATAVKTVTVSGFKLVTGARITVKFTNANTAISPTLNVNGSGAKYIQYVDSGASSLPSSLANYWPAGAVLEFVYTGSAWLVINGVVASTSVYGKTILSSSTSSTSEDVAATSKAVKTVNDRIDTAIQAAIQDTWGASY